MLRRRILYGLTLAAAALFQIYSKNYLGGFLLALALCLPLLALGLSLPAMLRCRVRLRPLRSSAVRGEEGWWFVELETPMPLSRVRVRLRTCNRLTGESESFRVTISGADRQERRSREADTTHCGRLECAAVSITVSDCLGLFSLRRRPPAPASMLSRPVPVEPGPLPALGDDSAGAVLLPRPGGGPGEDYDLRAYRPGDPVRQIHWKLSSKKDDLVIREVLESRRTVPVLTFDHFGAPEELDAVLDRLSAISQALLARERAHWIQWAEAASGTVRSHRITGRREWDNCLRAILSEPAPPSGRSILDCAARLPDGAVRRLHIRPEPPEAEVAS